jgi:type II secretory ATPase GspE/PulE/Tfp pilus assembly ATPase PilB-like protein
MLRQNPDTIMIGEIRDRETAQMAVRSALTGHLVFSTIHTNDAPSVIARLTDMGLEEYLVASALKGVLAQRLVRVNCQECRTKYAPPESVLRRAGLLELTDVFEFQRGVGCPHCRNTGYRGQTGIFEFVEITPYISEMIMRQASLREIKAEARENAYVPLFEMGLSKLREGLINLEELLKQTCNIENFFDPSQETRVIVSNADPL